MVVLFFAVNKGGKYTFSTREFAEYLKKSVLSSVDQKKVVALEDLVTNSLDSLLQINDELLNHDSEIEGFLRNLEKAIYDLDAKAEIQVNVKGQSLKIEDGISQFSWDESRYPKNQKKIEDILAKINEKFTGTRNNLKLKQDEFNAEKEKLNLKKKSHGEALGLMKTDYRVIVEKSRKNIITTDYLRTVLCFVPKQQKEQFLKSYQLYVDGMVVPNSALQLDVGEDERMNLFRVVIMEHAIEGFKNQLNSQLRIQSREYSEEEINRKPNDEREIEKLNVSLKEKKGQLIRNSTAGYSEVYYALLHLKFLRLYVECSLKYGNSDYYSTIIFIPHGKEQKVVSTLIKVFNDTNDQGWYGTKEDLKDTEDFYPFILIKLGVPTFI